MSKNTGELLLELKNATDIDSFFERNREEFNLVTVSEYLNSVLELKKLGVADVAKKSGLGEYVYKIFKGERKPSRDVLAAIALGMQMTVEEARLLFRISKKAELDSRDMRDSVIIFCLSHGKSVFETDDLLEGKGFTTIAK